MILHEEAVLKAFDHLAKQSQNNKYRYDPVAWAQDVLKVTLWSKQKEVLMSLVKHKKTAVKSCHATGKTFLSAIAVCWWISTRTEPKVRSTAPTSYQVHELLWSEIRKMHAKAKLAGEVNQKDEWKKNVFGAIDIVGSGKKPADGDTHSFHGVHSRDGVLTILDEGCFSRDTEVLTDSGWKDWEDVTMQDQLLTMNPDSMESEYLFPEKLIAYHYTGDMYEYEAKGANFMVTPNHEMLFGTTGNKNLRKSEIQDMASFNNTFFEKVIYWQGESPDRFTLPGHHRRGQGTPKDLNIEDWSTFLGWFASEGSINKVLDSVHIAQKKPEYRDEIRELLNRLPFSFFENENGFGISSVQLAEHLVEWGRTCDVKRVPDYVRGWSPELIERFVTAFRKGDGYMHRSQGILYTSCEDMANDLHELVLKMGLPSVIRKRELEPSYFAKEDRWITPSRGGFVVTVPPKLTRIWTKPHNLKKVAYDDMVYCATMPKNNTLFTRRKGYALWSGNCGIPQALYDAADAISTGVHDRVLTVGNPDDPLTPFGEIFLKYTEENKHVWNRITISAFDTPSFTGEPFPAELKENLIQPNWVEERGLEWGIDSGRYKSKILGEFPDQSDNTLFPQKTIYVAHETDIPEDFDFPLVLGVDIGGGGEDDTVIYGNRNGRVRKVANWNEGNALYTANRILDVAEEVKAEEIRIDSGGFGKAVVDVLLKDPRVIKFNVIRMMGGDASSDINSYRNKRAENYDYLRMQMELGKIDLDPKDTKVNEQLLGVKYETTERGSIKLEAKADIRKRNGKSPDDVDAIVYATADLSYLFDQDDHDEYETMSPLDYMNEMPGWASVKW